MFKPHGFLADTLARIVWFRRDPRWQSREGIAAGPVDGLRASGRGRFFPRARIDGRRPANLSPIDQAQLLLERDLQRHIISRLSSSVLGCNRDFSLPSSRETR